MAWIRNISRSFCWPTTAAGLAFATLASLSIFAAFPTTAWAGDDTLHLRLLTALSSQTSADGADFESVVTSNWPTGGGVAIPAGSLVRGKVMRARSVGLALRRETALMTLGFSEYVLGDGSRHPLWATLRSVDNAREKVHNGDIQGVHAASGPGGWVQGIWLRPRMTLIPRSLAGVVGLSGAIGNRLPFGPAGDAGLLVLRSLLFRLPKTGIRLPQGTDLKVSVSNLGPGHPVFEAVAEAELSNEEQAWVARQPTAITEGKGKPVPDLINVALSGSAKDVIAALSGAGWSQADSLSRDSFGRVYKAFTSMSGYRTAPVSPLYYGDSLPDLVFQKSLNTIAKRHHIRLWRAGVLNGQQMWVGAASHDVRMGIKAWPLGFTHHIDLKIDAERARVAEDLGFAGCAEPGGYVERAGLVAQPSKKAASTDGRLLMLPVHACSDPTSPVDVAEQVPEPAGPLVSRMVRRLVLETRYHLVQGNIYYKGFQLLRGHGVLFDQE